MSSILFLILGLALILIGANYLVDGAGNIAKKMGISDFIIGMTIVGIGTSAPEMVVSFISAIEGNADIAVGNVIGSNIFNVLVILGATAVIIPIPLTSDNIKKDIPFGLLAAATLVIAGNDIFLDGAERNIVSRTDGLLLFFLFSVFMAYTVYASLSSKNSQSNRDLQEQSRGEGAGEVKRGTSTLLSLIMVVGGLAALIFGGNLFVNSATKIAKMLGVSDAVIAVTILAGGTSLPELASCIAAALKKNTGLALGNVIGSNVFNIFLILGGSAIIQPLGMGNIKPLDLTILAGSAILLFMSAFTLKKRSIDRAEGALFILIYLTYIFMILK